MILQNCSVYCLVNEQDKKIDIRYTRDYKIAIQRLQEEIRQGSTRFARSIKPDLDKIQYRVIETVSLDLMKLRHAYWVKYYNELGYISYRDRVNTVEYRMMTLLNSEFTRTSMSLEVYLRNRANVKILVGVFDNVPELEEFVEQYYTSERSEHIVYCFNELTKKFYLVEK